MRRFAIILAFVLAARINIYGSPGGALIGQAELSNLRIPDAHCGEMWVRSELNNYGYVWVFRPDVPGLPLTGTELCPHPAKRGAE